LVCPGTCNNLHTKLKRQEKKRIEQSQPAVLDCPLLAATPPLSGYHRRWRSAVLPLSLWLSCWFPPRCCVGLLPLVVVVVLLSSPSSSSSSCFPPPPSRRGSLLSILVALPSFPFSSYSLLLLLVLFPSSSFSSFFPSRPPPHRSFPLLQQYFPSSWLCHPSSSSFPPPPRGLIHLPSCRRLVDSPAGLLIRLLGCRFARWVVHGVPYG